MVATTAAAAADAVVVETIILKQIKAVVYKNDREKKFVM